MSDPKNQADLDQLNRDKSGNRLRQGGEGQVVDSGLTKEEKGDQHNDSDGDAGGDDGDE